MPLTHMQIEELLDENRRHACDGYGPDHVCVRIAAIAELPSRFGDFHVIDWAGKERLLEQSDRPIVEGMTAEQIAALVGEGDR